MRMFVCYVSMTKLKNICNSFRRLKNVIIGPADIIFLKKNCPERKILYILTDDRANCTVNEYPMFCVWKRLISLFTVQIGQQDHFPVA